MYQTGAMLAIVGAIGFGWMWYNLRKHGYQPLQPDDPAEDEEEEYATG